MNKEKETLSLRFLYKTPPGRLILKALVRPGFSKAAGRFLSSPVSRHIVPVYKKLNDIDTGDCVLQKYDSFNEFFYRKRKEEHFDEDPAGLISPCDGLLSVYPIDEENTYRIKNVEYNLEQLLRDEELAQSFSGGLCLIFRLTPKHYHRYCFAADGEIVGRRRIEGVLHCVRPIAYTNRPVFMENSREYVEIDTKTFGKIIQMEVGALMVGKIHNHENVFHAVKGQEKGCFEFGGSTIIVITQKDCLDVPEEYLQKTKLGLETDVRKGQIVGRAR